jgi:hypothetical protein
MKVLVEEKHINLTVAKAEEFLAINVYPKQRAIEKRHLEEMIEDHLVGDFLEGQIVVAKLNYDGGGEIGVNGQHQSRMVIATGKPARVEYLKYEVDSPDDLASLFRHCDQGSVRNMRQQAIMEAVALGISHWKDKVINIIVAGATLKDGKGHATKDARVGLLRLYLGYGRFLNDDLLVGGKPQFLFRAPVVWAIFDTLDKSRDVAKRFWLDVRDCENLTKTDAAHRLHDYLISKSLGNSRYCGPRGIVASVAEMHAYCVHEWNNFRKGTNVRFRFTGKSPKAI